jgi:hypothetical protein
MMNANFDDFDAEHSAAQESGDVFEGGFRGDGL